MNVLQRREVSVEKIVVGDNWPRETLLRILQLNGKTPEAAGIIVNLIKAKWRIAAEKVYICCPAGETGYTAQIEMLAARAYIREAEATYGVRGIAPHAYLPEILNNNIPSERELADSIDQQLLALCSRIFVCGNRLSPRMKISIDRAAGMEKQIIVFCRSLIPDVIKIVSESGAKNQSVYSGRQGIMSMDPVRLGKMELKRAAGEVIG